MPIVKNEKGQLIIELLATITLIALFTALSLRQVTSYSKHQRTVKKSTNYFDSLIDAEQSIKNYIQINEPKKGFSLKLDNSSLQRATCAPLGSYSFFSCQIISDINQPETILAW